MGLPTDAVPYKRTREFDQDTVPAGLLREHSTKAGVWGRIVVTHGRLILRVPGQATVVLTAGESAIAEPEQLHEVEPDGEVRFHVEFLRVGGPDGPGSGRQV